MPNPARAVRLRSILLYSVALLAIVLLSTAIYVVVSGDDTSRHWQELGTDDPTLPAVPPPSLVFPEQLRTYNLELNRFVDRFIRLIREGRYSEFRECCTRQLDPVSADAFVRLWDRVRQVQIIELQPLPRSLLRGMEPWSVTVHVTFDASDSGPPRERVNRVFIIREHGEWVLAPVTISRLMEMARASSQPAATVPASAPASTDN